MTLLEVKNHLCEEAKKYKKEDFKLFAAEIGWEDWMNDYTTADEGEPITEKESKAIDEILQECFNNSH